MPHRWKPNVTVAAVIERDGRFLLVEEQTSEGLRLNNPAGHLDPGESLMQACVRETLEETAFHFLPDAVVGIYMTGPAQSQPPGATPTSKRDITYLRFAFRGALGGFDPQRRLDKGIVRTVWLSPQEIRACRDRHRSPALERCVEDYLAGARYSLDLLSTDFGLPGCGA